MSKLAMVLLGGALVMSGCRGCHGCGDSEGGEGGIGRAGGMAGARGAVGTSGSGRKGGVGAEDGVGRGAGKNECPFFRSVLISPVSQAVGEIVNVDIRVHDLEGDEVEVRVTSSCGHVADPIQTGSSMTTVGCEKAKPCSISIRLSDDGFAPNGCNGMRPGSLSTTKINCHP